MQVKSSINAKVIPDREDTHQPGFLVPRGYANDPDQPLVVERSRNHNPGYIYSRESPNRSSLKVKHGIILQLLSKYWIATFV
jgi:hypothetical protein